MKFAYSLSAIIRTEKRAFGSCINVIIPFCVEFNKSNNSISGYFINMYFGSGGFNCYMTSQSENAAIASLGGTSYVLSPGYSQIPSARQCVLPSIESIKASKQLFCLNSLN